MREGNIKKNHNNHDNSKAQSLYIIQMGACMCKHAVKKTPRKHAVMCRDAEQGGYKLQLILFRASLKATAALWRRLSLGRAFQRVLPTNVND